MEELFDLMPWSSQLIATVSREIIQVATVVGFWNVRAFDKITRYPKNKIRLHFEYPGNMTGSTLFRDETVFYS